MDKDFLIQTSNDNWSARMEPGSGTPLIFQLNGKDLLIIEGAGFSSVMHEKSSEPKKNRLHESVDGLSRRVEMESNIPFGSEPRIRRSLDFYGNYCKVICDLELFHLTPVEYVSIDPLNIPEVPKRIGIIPMPETGEGVREINWIDTPSGQIYNSDKPFLIALFEFADGKVLEVGTGDDLWRWLSADLEPELSAEFSINVNNSGVNVTRKILTWTERTMVERRTRRCKWYFAWSTTPVIENTDTATESFNLDTVPEVGTDVTRLDFSNAEFPDFTNIIADESELPFPCFHSTALLKRLRKWVRSVAGSAPGCKIELCNAEPHLCDSAIHLDRGKKKNMLHWDIMSLIDFRNWGDQQLRKNDGSLAIIPPNGNIAAVLPSMNNKGSR